MAVTVYEARRLSRRSIALNGVMFAVWAVVVLVLADAGSGAARVAAGVLGLAGCWRGCPLSAGSSATAGGWSSTIRPSASATRSCTTAT